MLPLCTFGHDGASLVGRVVWVARGCFTPIVQRHNWVISFQVAAAFGMAIICGAKLSKVLCGCSTKMLPMQVNLLLSIHIYIYINFRKVYATEVHLNRL